MKKIIISIVIAFICIAANAQKNIIKTNPFGLAFGNINLIYERLLNNHSSILVKGQYGYNLLGTSVNLFGCGVDYRYYFTYAKKAVLIGIPLLVDVIGQPLGECGNGIGVQTERGVREARRRPGPDGPHLPGLNIQPQLHYSWTSAEQQELSDDFRVVDGRERRGILQHRQAG